MKIIKCLISFSAAGIVYFQCTSVSSDRAQDIFVLAASLSGTLLGFVLVAVSILMALSNRALIQKLVISGHYTELKKELFSSAVSMFLNIIFAFFFLFIGSDYLLELISILTLTFVYSLSSISVVGYKFYLVMQFVDNN